MFKDVPTLLWHTGVLYIVALVTFRFMGKRAIAHLAPFDIAVIIMIGEAVAIGIEEPSKPITMAIIPIIFLGALQLALTFINMLSWRAEDVTQGTDTVLIRNGRVNRKNLWKERISKADLLTSLRQNGITSVKDVQEARLEPTGSVSVIPTPAAGPLTQKAAGIQGQERLVAVLEEEIAALRKEIHDLSRRFGAKTPEPSRGS